MGFRLIIFCVVNCGMILIVFQSDLQFLPSSKRDRQHQWLKIQTPIAPIVHPKLNTGKEPFKCGMRPSSPCFDAARSAECAPI
jgi:hypothetical protein